jgi:hypothetical protein
MAIVKTDLAKEATGAKKPRSFLLDSSVLLHKEEMKIIREDIKQNNILFYFPEGFNQLDLVEECRAIQNPDDFDLMFDITMQMLVGKSVVILCKNRRGERIKQLEFQVTDQYQNLRGYDFIDTYPTVILWLVEDIGAYLLKKFPMPGNDTNGSPKASKAPKEPKQTTRPYRVE